MNTTDKLLALFSAADDDMQTLIIAVAEAFLTDDQATRALIAIREAGPIDREEFLTRLQAIKEVGNG